MRKKIALALLAVALLVAGAAGGVYAVNGHQPVQGQKLVGVGPLGISEPSPIRTEDYNTVFRFTNPDCLHEITITQVSILKGGAVIYEGPYIRVDGDDREIVTTLLPHEGQIIVLCNYMYTGLGADPDDLTDPDNWLDSPTALNQDISSYTVEIAWEAKGKVCPLTGWQRTRVHGEDIWGTKYAWGAESQMVNMK